MKRTDSQFLFTSVLLCPGVFLWLGFVALVRGQDSAPKIEIWYGQEQSFGKLGHPQRWINILGSVDSPEEIVSLRYSLNGDEPSRLSFDEDRKRIARDGDFNVEIDRQRLRVGENVVVITATLHSGSRTSKRVQLHYHQSDGGWPLPYRVDWSEVDRIQDAVQVVDGRWRLTAEGIRTVGRYYDRLVCFGDSSWTDYEVTTTVTVHALTAPRSPPNDTGVTHAAIALRWPGHDADGLQPTVKWYPLGATAEFRLGADLQRCRWRIFDGKREFYVESSKQRVLQFNRGYHMKHRVESLADGISRYRVKLWPVGDEEPEDWDLERLESGDLPGGSACLIAHHSDVTFGDIMVRPIKAAKASSSSTSEDASSSGKAPSSDEARQP